MNGVGYTTKGRGVSVHRKDCINVCLDEDKQNKQEKEWLYIGIRTIYSKELKQRFKF